MLVAIGTLLAAMYGSHSASPGYGDIFREYAIHQGCKPALAADLGLSAERASLGKGPVTRVLVALEGAVRGPGGPPPAPAATDDGEVNISIVFDDAIRPLRVINGMAFLCANEVFVNTPVTDGMAPVILIELQLLDEMEEQPCAEPGEA